MSKIKTSLFMRSLSLARMTINTGSSLASHGLTSWMSSDEQKKEKWAELLRSQATQISGELGELKGSLMKAGQMLSMYGEYFLPPEANEILKSLQGQSPAVEWSQIESVLKSNLGELLSDLEVDREPIGTASLGQVHKARIKSTDEIVAVKVQYPDLDKAVDSDLYAIRSFLSLLKILPRSIATDQIFSEVKEMLQQELDYGQEANLTERYGKLLVGDSRFIVPKVYRKYSTPKVLVTSFEEGLRADAVAVQNLPLKRRNQISMAFLELYFKELFEWGVVQTDPHLGNYKIRLGADNDKLILLDFGAVRTYPEAFLVPYTKMVYAAFQNDTALLEKNAEDLKFLAEGDPTDLKKYFIEFCIGTVEPFLTSENPGHNPEFLNLHEEYNWKKSDLPQRLTKKVFKIIQTFKVRAPPREVLFLDRKTGGVFIFLKVLGAQLNAHQMLKSYLEKKLHIKDGGQKEGQKAVQKKN